MKKLMTVIAAVAMSFGLFADATPFSISFEAAEGASGTAKGVDISTMKFTPPTEGWTWGGDALDMLAYAGDAYDYTTTRRSFDDQDNLNYLKLETSDKELARAMGDGNIFVDQLVKFTGFEEPQTNLVEGTKIAVWMSGTETDETVVGETNLYVTVGQVDADGKLVKQVAFAIDNPADGAEWKTEKWYRLTIKSIGNIFGEGSQLDARAGFIVYIDGVQVATSDEAAKTIVAATGDLSTAAAGYMAKGQLFPAIDATDATFKTVAYKGIGAIDDVILDDQGPDFCQFVNVTVTAIDGAVIKVEQDGKEITIGDDGKYAVAPGTFTVTYTADDGYILTPVAKTHNTADLVDNTVDDSDDVKPAAVVVEVTYDWTNTVAYADADSALLAVALYTQTPGNTVNAEFKQGATNLVAGYAFDKGVAISISDDYDETEPEKQLSSIWGINGGNVTFLTGLENNKKVTFTGTVEEVPTYTLTFGGVMKAGSQIITDSFDAEDDSITLDPTDCFVAVAGDCTIGGLGYKAKFAEVAGYKISEEYIENEESVLNDYTVYKLVKAEPTIDYVTFTVTYDASKVENVTVKTNGEAVVGNLNKYTVESNAVVTITAEAKDGFKNVQIESDHVTVKDGVFTADKADALISITAEAMVYAKVPDITTSYTYNGAEQTAQLDNGEGYVVVGDSDKQTNAGLHRIEVALAEGYDAWEDDDTTANKFVDWTILQAVVNVTAVDQTIKVGEKPAEYTATVSPKPFGTDTIAYTVACPTYEDKEGEYAIVVTPTPGANPNYDVSGTPGKLKVEAAGPVIPEPEDLPEAEKTAYNNWYTSNPADPGDVALTKSEDLKDAYLLGCKAGEEALEAARKEFKFASIEFKDGAWVATIKNSTGDSHEYYGNGAITVKSYSDVECKTEAANGNFFKATLGYKTK